MSTSIEAYITRVVEAAPPLQPWQRHRLAAIFGDKAEIAAPLPRLNHMTPPKVVRTALYRHYDAEGALLYVGIAKDPTKRRGQHERHSAWVEFAKSERVEWHDSRGEAEAAERVAIRDEAPLFNSQHAATGRNDRLVQYLVGRGAFHLLTVGVAS